MVDRPLADKRLIGPFFTNNNVCPKVSNFPKWYSSILDKRISLTDYSNSMLEEEFNRRYEQDYEDMSEHLKRTLGMRVGDIGQTIFVADKTRPSGVVRQTRKEWMEENSRDEYLINGIRNIHQLQRDILSEMPNIPCIFRGLSNDIARSVKHQKLNDDKVTYPTLSIEFWTNKRNTAATFAFEGIGNRGDVNDAVIIAKRINIDEILGIEGDDMTLLPKTDDITIPSQNVEILQ